MLKRLLLASILFLCFSCFSLGYADVDDLATLGGANATQVYDWRVNASGYLLPGHNVSRDIGDTTHTVNNIVASNLTLVGKATVTGNITSSGNITASKNITIGGTSIFNSTFVSNGYTNAGVSDGQSTTALPVTVGTSLVLCTLGNQTLTVANGAAIGQMLTIQAKPLTDMGWVKVTATTKKGWGSLIINNSYGFVTMNWLDSTNGWILVGTGGDIQYGE